MKAGRVLEAGQPSTVIRPDLVQDVYGVTVTVDNNEIVNLYRQQKRLELGLGEGGGWLATLSILLLPLPAVNTIAGEPQT